MEKDNLRNLYAKLGPAGRRGTSASVHPLESVVESIRVRIIGPSGHTLIYKCDSNKSLLELMNQAILELRKNPTKLLIATDPNQHYRLIRADFEATELDENLTLEELQIVDNETLLMLERRDKLQQYLKQTDENCKPTAAQIQTATRYLQMRCADETMLNSQEIFQHSNLQFGARKIMIPLAKASAVIIGAGPLARPLITSIQQKLITKQNNQQFTLDSLIDMGFKKEMAEHALKQSNGVYAEALERVLQYQNDGTPPEGAFAPSKKDSLISLSKLNTDDSVVKNTEALLQIVRIYSHLEITPSMGAIDLFLEMGFDKQDAINALTKTYNNIPDACAYLCGDRDEYLTELHDGVGQNSPILKTILEMPAVQFKLGDPMLFLVVLSLIMNEIPILGTDGHTEISFVVKTILRTYNEEKHFNVLNLLHEYRF